MKRYIKKFYAHLSKETIIKEEKPTNWFTIDLPFLDFRNDNICIYGKKSKDEIMLSDSETTLINLEQIGINFKKSKVVESIIYSILDKHNISLVKEILVRKCNKKTFNNAVFDMIAAITEINALSNIPKNVWSKINEDTK